MQKIFLFIIVNLFIGSVFAQYTFPEYQIAPNWYVENNQTGNIEHYSYTKDTSFCGLKYSKLSTIQYIDNKETYKFTGYIRTDNNKTYIRTTSSCNDKEYLIYDFSLSVGDETYCGYNLLYLTSGPTDFVDTTKFVVTESDIVEVFGKERKQLKLKYKVDPMYSETQFEMTWLEGIGSLSHPFYSFYDWNNKSVSFELACYDSLNVLLYKNETLNYNCTTGTGSINYIEETLKDYTLIYPNPAKDLITVQLQNKTIAEINKISLVDINGKTLDEIIKPDKTNVTFMLPDNKKNELLFILIELKDEIVIKKIIKL